MGFPLEGMPSLTIQNLEELKGIFEVHGIPIRQGLGYREEDEHDRKHLIFQKLEYLMVHREVQFFCIFL